MRRILLLAGTVVFFDTLFFAALVPLLPHYAHTLALGKAGAGVLAAAYPAGALIGALPSGLVAARAGVKPTVLVGLSAVAVCTVVFGISEQAWFAAAVGGALFGPVLGGVATIAGTSWTFGVVGVGSLGLVAFAATTASTTPETPQPLRELVGAVRDRQVLGGFWFVVLPALLFGVLDVLAPLRLSKLGLGGVAIGTVFLCSAAFEAANNVLVGRISDRSGTALPILAGLAGSVVTAALLPWPHRAALLVPLVALGGVCFGSFFTPGMTLLTHLSEARGLDYGYTFALVTLAWAPGQALGSAGGGALAHATADAVPYLGLAGLCALTFAAAWRARASTAWSPPSGNSLTAE
jgi:predicted MFS family arabinose efflux permease